MIAFIMVHNLKTYNPFKTHMSVKTVCLYQLLVGIMMPATCRLAQM